MAARQQAVEEGRFHGGEKGSLLRPFLQADVPGQQRFPVEKGGERFVSAAAAPPGGAQAEAALGRPLLPGDTAYAPGAVPFSFAVENGDGTFFVAFSENGSVRQIPAWNFWLACKAQCAEETFMR